MPIFKVPGPLGVNVPGPNVFGRDPFYANGIGVVA